MPTGTRARSAMGVAAISLLLVTTGCGKVAEKASEKVTEKAIESAAGDGVDVDLDGDGNVDIKTEDGSYSAQAGKVPDSWPEDVPLPENLVVQSGTELADTASGKTVSITASTTESAEKIKGFYVEAMGGWTEAMNTTMSADGGEHSQLMYEKDGRSLMIVASGGDGETAVMVSHTEKVSP